MTKLTHVFVKSVPEQLEDGVIYVSIEYATAIHKCCCGCGNQVVTPLSPRDWKLTFDGETISLQPSIGNWNFKCRSHYWITRNRVEWCAEWDKSSSGGKPPAEKREPKGKRHGIWRRFFRRK